MGNRRTVINRTDLPSIFCFFLDFSKCTPWARSEGASLRSELLKLWALVGKYFVSPSSTATGAKWSYSSLAVPAHSVLPMNQLSRTLPAWDLSRVASTHRRVVVLKIKSRGSL